MAPKIELFDSTFREGLQLPELNIYGELVGGLALELVEAGMKKIEVGFPLSNYVELDALNYMNDKKHRRVREKAELVALAITRQDSIDAVYAAGCDGVAFGGTSILIKSMKGRFSKYTDDIERIFDLYKYSIEYASEYGLRTYFYIEDAAEAFMKGEEHRRFLGSFLEALNDSKLDVVDLSDTTGYARPADMKAMVEWTNTIIDRKKIELFVHCHNDLGLGVANSLAAVEAEGSVDLLSCSINGLGERAGLPATEDLAVILEKTYGIDTGLDMDKVYEICSKVVDHFEIPVQYPRPVKHNRGEG